VTTYVRAFVIVGEPDSDDVQECPDCGYDALLSFPLHLLSPNGVTPFGYRIACARCWEESQ
jgi:hypothetical protein